MRSKKLTCSFYVGGKQVESLTEEQSKRIADKLATALSLYYTAHPEEYQALKVDAGKEA